MRQPLQIREGISLVNSMIEGTDIQKKSIEYKTKRNMLSTLGGMVGWEYWRGFYKRYEYILSSKNPVTYDRKEEEWCTKANFKQMYDQIYK